MNKHDRVTGEGGGGKQNEDWHMAVVFDAECMMTSLFQGMNHSSNSDIVLVISFAVLQLSKLWCDSALDTAVVLTTILYLGNFETILYKFNFKRNFIIFIRNYRTEMRNF